MALERRNANAEDTKVEIDVESQIVNSHDYRDTSDSLQGRYSLVGWVFAARLLSRPTRGTFIQVLISA